MRYMAVVERLNDGLLGFREELCHITQNNKLQGENAQLHKEMEIVLQSGRLYYVFVKRHNSWIDGEMSAKAESSHLI